MPIVELPVARIEQQPGLCGAATAQMILHFKSVVGPGLADQLALWGEIQDNTNGNRPRSAVRPHDCPKWPKQDCSRCNNETTFTCWCTHPAALEATLVENGQAVLLTAHNIDLQAAASILDSVDAQLPPAVLVKNGLHWLAVSGYVTGTSSLDGTPIDGRFVSEIYIRNPTVGAANQSVAIDVWLDEYLSPVIQCGPFRDLLPVIAAAPPGPAGPVAPQAPTNLRVVKRPRRRRRPPKPHGPPPRPGPRRRR